MKRKSSEISLKKTRLPNFSFIEESTLLSLVEEKLFIIENKRTDAETWEAKKMAWDEIAKIWKEKFDVDRGRKNIKDKYENLKRLARKSIMTNTPIVDPAVQRVFEFMTAADTATSKFQNKTDSFIEPTDSRSRSVITITNNPSPVSVCDSVPEFDEDRVSDTMEEEALQEKLIQTEIVEIKEDTDDFLPTWSTNSISGKQNYSTPAQLKRKSHHMEMEKCSLMEAKKTFYLNEELRAAEKHGWEREQAILKKEILLSELEFKKKQLQRLNFDI